MLRLGIGVGAIAPVVSSIGSTKVTAWLGALGAAGATICQLAFQPSASLHTPLMSVTNAISGITAAGALMLLGQGGGAVAQTWAKVAVGISAVNLVGAFMVSKRMFDMFKKKDEPSHYNKFLLPTGFLVAAPWVCPSRLPSTGAASGLLCMGSIAGLSSMSTWTSNIPLCEAYFCLGAAGAAGVISATLSALPAGQVLPGLGLIAGGGIVGLLYSLRVAPMSLPQTVAALHSLAGVAAMLTCFAGHFVLPEAGVAQKFAAMLGNCFGTIVFTGSLITFAKLNGNLPSKPVDLSAKRLLNVGAAGLQMAIFASFCSDVSTGRDTAWMLATTALSAAFGAHVFCSNKGGDLPCCMSLLNSYSGIALVAEGALLQSPVLTTLGVVLAMSGYILLKWMCDAMDRSIFSIVSGNMYVPKPPAKPVASRRAVVDLLLAAKNVMIVPGWGMAKANAHFAVVELANFLSGSGIDIRFCIHPVAGRKPGQMNHLLTQAGVDYGMVKELDEVTDWSTLDFCLMVGANDIVNSAAETEKGSPIFEMPVAKVWQSRHCIFLERTIDARGYADVDNPVFLMENSRMLLDDAKSSCEKLIADFKDWLA